MADSYNKKERDKKRKKRKLDKAEEKARRKQEGKKQEEFMYMDEDGNLSPTPPDPTKKRKEIALEDINISTPKKSELPQEDPVKEGFVKFFNEEKQYGFINKTGTNEDYFVHIDNCLERIKDRDKVTFELGSGPKGIIAINVKIAKKEAPKPKPPVKPEGEAKEVAAKTEEGATKPEADAKNPEE